MVPVGLCGHVTEIKRVTPGRTRAVICATSSCQASSNVTSTMSSSAPMARGVSRFVA